MGLVSSKFKKIHVFAQEHQASGSASMVLNQLQYGHHTIHRICSQAVSYVSLPLSSPPRSKAALQLHCQLAKVSFKGLSTKSSCQNMLAGIARTTLLASAAKRKHIKAGGVAGRGHKFSKLKYKKKT